MDQQKKSLNNRLRISIVIPVYNEADYLNDCLQAIAAQTVNPFEVIVVDNNSTDATVHVARRYPFVTLLSESRQGVIYARNRGFNAAKGDIIGRIDADSLMARDWVATIQAEFAALPRVAAMTGQVSYYGLPLAYRLSRIDFYIRKRLAQKLGRELAMQGANLAVRRKAWHATRHQMCHGGSLHEDFDLSIHLFQAGYENKFCEQLRVSIDCRRLESNWTDFVRYVHLSPQTYALHHLRSRRHMYPVVVLALVAYWPLRMMHKGYNVKTKRFEYRRLLTNTMLGRVNPATYVD